MQYSETSISPAGWTGRILASLAVLLVAGAIWWIAATLTTSWLLGHSPWFQQIIILVIATLQTSGLFTLIALGGIYLLTSALEIVLWPVGPRRMLLLLFWVPVGLLDCFAVYQGFGVYYVGLATSAGLPAEPSGQLVLGVLLAPLLALGPEALLVILLRRIWRIGTRYSSSSAR